MSEKIDDLFEQTKNHAIQYRKRIANNESRSSADFEPLKEAFSEPTPETGMDGKAVIDQMARVTEGGLLPTTGSRFLVGSLAPHTL